MKKLYILTLTWNQCEKLSRLKETLLPALVDIDYTWLIKDNNSNDNTCEIAADWGSNITVTKYKNNLQNFSQGMNFLFDVAAPDDNDYILLLNNDVTFGDTKSIKNMLSLLKGDVGIVGSKLLYTNSNKIQHGGVVIEPRYMLPVHFRANQEDDENASKNRYFQAVTGAVMLLKADDYRKMGRMPEEMNWAFDDIWACMSVRANLGKKIVYCGNTKIFHEESLSLKKNPVNRLFMKANINLFKEKWKDKYVSDLEIYTKDTKYNLV